MTHTPSLFLLEVSFKNCYNAGELVDLEGFLHRIPRVKGVHLDRTRSVAHLSYNPAETDPTKLRYVMQPHPTTPIIPGRTPRAKPPTTMR